MCELSELKRQNTHHPQFCTRDVDRRFCGGGAWISRSDFFVASKLPALPPLRWLAFVNVVCLHLLSAVARIC